MEEAWRRSIEKVLPASLFLDLEEQFKRANATDEGEALPCALFDDEDVTLESSKNMVMLAELLAADSSLADALHPQDIPEAYRSPLWLRIFRLDGTQVAEGQHAKEERSDESELWAVRVLSFDSGAQQRPPITIPVVLGASAHGHGDVVWCAAEFCALVLAELTADALCVKSLADCHVLEVGAGAGLPSCAALRLGAASVLASDVADTQRMLALATSLALNLRVAHCEQSKNGATATVGDVQVVAHRWGENCQELRQSGKDGCGFDLILCCDCIYFPELHGALLQTLRSCLADGGTVLVCFSLHGNCPDDQVWNFFDEAKTSGFRVESFGERQMPSRCSNMPAKRSYVYAFTLRFAG